MLLAQGILRSSSREYTIYELLPNGFKREVDLPATQYDDPDDRAPLSLRIYDATPLHLGLATFGYSRLGKVNSLILFMHTRDDQERVKYHERGLEENLHELVDIFKTAGSSMFTMGVGESDTDTTAITLLAEAMIYTALDKKFGDESALEAIQMEVVDVVAQAMKTYLREEVLNVDERVAIAERIVAEMIELELSNNFYYLDEEAKRQQLTKGLDRAIANILWNYNYKLTSAGDFFVDFTPTSEDLSAWHVSVSDNNLHSVLKDDIKDSEGLTFSEYIFTIKRIDSNIQIGIKRKARSSTHMDIDIREITIPQSLDIEQIKSIASIEGITGWERALDLVPASVR